MGIEVTALWVNLGGLGRANQMRKAIVDVGEGAIATTAGMYGGGLRIFLVTVPTANQEGEPEAIGALYFDAQAEADFRKALDAVGK